ncbi:MAG: putative aminohydrolase SsnA [Spirochaetales bacterium]|nr:putative aminohydrolase SsnA [Spirochaetales bacterium]
MILIKNALALEFDPPRIREGMNILIENDRIKEVSSTAALPAGEAGKTIDARGGLVFPGIVCSHNHYYSGLARGIMADIGPTPDFVSTLKNLWWRMDRALDEDSLYSSGLICSLDAVRAGTTSVIDHHAGPSCIEGSLATLKSAFEKVGLRGASCYEVTDRNGRDEMLRGVKENIDFAKMVDKEKADGTGPGLFEAHIGAHAPCTVPEEGLELLADAVKQTGKGLHIHVAEDRYDVSHSHVNYGKDLIRRLDDSGIINDKSLIVHGIFLSPEEIEIINDRDAFLVHNSRSNMNNGVGYNKNLPLLKNLALGTDGIGNDMFEEFKFAYFKHKDAGGAWWPGDFLSALQNGNRILERNFGKPFGRLEEGYTADIVIADYNAPTPLVPENIAGHMAFGMGSSIVRTVVIGGNIVLEERKFPEERFPEGVEAIYAKARKDGKAMWERMNTIAP